MIKIIIKLKKVILASLSKLRVSGEPGWRVSKFMKCRARNKLGDKKLHGRNFYHTSSL